MEKESDVKEGARVRAHQHHWLRANSAGKIVEIDFKRGDHSMYVQFDDAIAGGGIDGDKLWMNPRELVLEAGPRRPLELKRAM